MFSDLTRSEKIRFGAFTAAFATAVLAISFTSDPPLTIDAELARIDETCNKLAMAISPTREYNNHSGAFIAGCLAHMIQNSPYTNFDADFRRVSISSLQSGEGRRSEDAYYFMEMRRCENPRNCSMF